VFLFAVTIVAGYLKFSLLYPLHISCQSANYLNKNKQSWKSWTVPLVCGVHSSRYMDNKDENIRRR